LDTYSLALSFARWRNKLPADAMCLTAPGSPAFIAQPQGLRRWLRRTTSHQCRIAFALGDEWWAYDLLDVTSRRGTSGSDTINRYFVIASSDRYDPEWGADFECDAQARIWKLSADVPDVTSRRLASLQIKA
jgi:hypothetical protein